MSVSGLGRPGTSSRSRPGSAAACAAVLTAGVVSSLAGGFAVHPVRRKSTTPTVVRTDPITGQSITAFDLFVELGQLRTTLRLALARHEGTLFSPAESEHIAALREREARLVKQMEVASRG